MASESQREFKFELGHMSSLLTHSLYNGCYRYLAHWVVVEGAAVNVALVSKPFPNKIFIF